MLRWIAAGIAVSIGVADAQVMERRFANEAVTQEQWQALFQEIAGLPGAKRAPIPGANVFTVTVAKEYATYLFTTPGHPAHPAAVRRLLVLGSSGSGTRVLHDGVYAGDKAAFLKWLGDVQASTPAAR